MFSSLPRMAPKYRRHVGEFGTVKCADIDAFDQRVSTFLACKFAVDGEFQTCAMHLTTRVLLPYDRTIPQGYGLGRPEHRRSSRAPQYESAAFFFPRLRWGTERFMAGPCGTLRKEGAGSYVRSTNLHGLPPSLGRGGGRFIPVS